MMWELELEFVSKLDLDVEPEPLKDQVEAQFRSQTVVRKDSKPGKAWAARVCVHEPGVWWQLLIARFSVSDRKARRGYLTNYPGVWSRWTTLPALLNSMSFGKAAF
jgi:hypothetical protein